jgi:hypothetical protein
VKQKVKQCSNSFPQFPSFWKISFSSFICAIFHEAFFQFPSLRKLKFNIPGIEEEVQGRPQKIFVPNFSELKI